MKIHIVGGPGSGKSFIASRLSAVTGIPHFDLDNIVWINQPDQYGVKAPVQSRDENLREILSQESWIVEGVYYKWLHESFRIADKIFVLTPNVYLRHWRILKRFVKRKLGLEKSGYRENLDNLRILLKWNHQYDFNNLAGAMKMLEEFSGKLIVCRSNKDIIRWISLYSLFAETISESSPKRY